jgi:hypothetical protein
MREKTQTESWKLVKKLHIEIYAYRSKEVGRLILNMTFQSPGNSPITVDIDLPEWRRRRKGFGKLIGFQKRNDVTTFFYQLKKLSA